MTETITVSMEKAILLDLFSPEELQAKRVTADDSQKLAIDAHLEAKAKAEGEARILDTFTSGLNALEVPKEVPEGIYNIYRSRVRNSRPLNAKEVKELLSANPNLDEADVTTRRLELEGYHWGEWVINKAMTTSTSTTTRKVGTRKLAITLNKRDGNSLSPVGNFRTSKEACVYLGLETKGDSANRVLLAHHYITDDYDGDSFLVKEV